MACALTLKRDPRPILQYWDRDTSPRLLRTAIVCCECQYRYTLDGPYPKWSAWNPESSRPGTKHCHNRECTHIHTPTPPRLRGPFADYDVPGTPLPEPDYLLPTFCTDCQMLSEARVWWCWCDGDDPRRQLTNELQQQQCHKCGLGAEDEGAGWWGWKTTTDATFGSLPMDYTIRGMAVPREVKQEWNFEIFNRYHRLGYVDLLPKRYGGMADDSVDDADFGFMRESDDPIESWGGRRYMILDNSEPSWHVEGWEEWKIEHGIVHTIGLASWHTNQWHDAIMQGARVFW